MNIARQGETLIASGVDVRGETLVLTAPISFWGGIDAKTGRVADPRHPQCGESVSGRVLFLPETIGSSSASAVLLELIHTARAPAAIILHEPDAILLLGLIVAGEMGWQHPPAVKLDRRRYAAFHGRTAAVRTDGRVETLR